MLMLFQFVTTMFLVSMFSGNIGSAMGLLLVFGVILAIIASVARSL